MTTYAERRRMLRTYVRGNYDLQKLRIATGNRICVNFAAKLGMDLTKKGRPVKDAKPADDDAEPDLTEVLTEEEKIKVEADPAKFDTKKVKELFDLLRASHARITDGIVGLPREKKFKGDNVISEFAELVLIDTYLNMLKNEEASFQALHNVLMRDFPIYRDWLYPEVVGVAHTMGAVICAEIDIYIADTASKIWKFGGMDVAPDGAGRSKRKEHLVQREYVKRDGTKEMRDSVTFSPFLKTKLLGVLGPIFVKQSPEKSKYRRLYDMKKEYYRTHEYWGEHNDKAHKKLRVEEEKKKLPREQRKMPGHRCASPGHRHNMAIRYAVKQFLLDLYLVWRKMEGLPIAPKPDFSKPKPVAVGA